MTAAYDPALCERLIAESRNGTLTCTACDGKGYTEHSGPISGDWTESCEPCNVTGMRAIENLSAMADQLEAAGQEIDGIKTCLARAYADANEAEALLTAERDALRAEVERLHDVDRRNRELETLALEQADGINAKLGRVAALEIALRDACDALDEAFTHPDTSTVRRLRAALEAE